MIHLTLIVKNYVERPTGVSRREARHCLMLVIIKQHITPPFKSRLCLQINTLPPLLSFGVARREHPNCHLFPACRFDHFMTPLTPPLPQWFIPSININNAA